MEDGAATGGSGSGSITRPEATGFKGFLRQ
jgi:hypothetical protein